MGGGMAEHFLTFLQVRLCPHQIKTYWTWNIAWRSLSKYFIFWINVPAKTMAARIQLSTWDFLFWLGLSRELSSDLKLMEKERETFCLIAGSTFFKGIFLPCVARLGLKRRGEKCTWIQQDKNSCLYWWKGNCDGFSNDKCKQSPGHLKSFWITTIQVTLARMGAVPMTSHSLKHFLSPLYGKMRKNQQRYAKRHASLEKGHTYLRECHFIWVRVLVPSHNSRQIWVTWIVCIKFEEAVATGNLCRILMINIYLNSHFFGSWTVPPGGSRNWIVLWQDRTLWKCKFKDHSTNHDGSLCKVLGLAIRDLGKQKRGLSETNHQPKISAMARVSPSLHIHRKNGLQAWNTSKNNFVLEGETQTSSICRSLQWKFKTFLKFPFLWC